MRTTRWIVPGTLAALAMFALTQARAVEGQGLAVAADSGGWSPWQGRIAYASAAPVWRSGLGGFESGGFTVKRGRGVTSVNLLGDYYFFTPAPGASGGGLRATSGLIIGPRAQLSINQPGVSNGLFASGGRAFGSASLPYNVDAGVEPVTLPYLGVGYTGLASGSGWSFSADLGMVGSGTSNAASRLLGTGQRTLEDLSRDTRLMPLVQVGVQYAF